MTRNQTNAPPVALTIAGLDPSGGAGIIADIKTFNAFGCFATAVVTSLTYQNTLGIFGAVHQTAQAVRAQVLSVVEDFEVACMKTGMLPTREVILEVARLFRETALPAPVVDPVVRSTSGYDLIDDAALSVLVGELLPLARIVTPNIPEAERITGLRIEDEEGMRRAARAMREMGARAVLVKGGHLGEQEASGNLPRAENGGPDAAGVEGQASSRESLKASRDSLKANHESLKANHESLNDNPVALDLLDDGRVTLFREKRIITTSTHGTGCTLAAAVAACLGRGMTLIESVSAAKSYVTEAIRRAPALGHGHGPLNHNIVPRFDQQNFQPDTGDSKSRSS
jgi:hydroxymethylpyrimidine kinase/phosphomethylpyrimidine kinase